MRAKPPHPAERYINRFLYELVLSKKPLVCVDRSDPLPILDGLELPIFDRFINGLRGMAKLHLVPRQRTRSGIIDIGIDRQEEGQWYFECYRVEIRISSGSTFVEFHIGCVSRMPGIDPARCL